MADEPKKQPTTVQMSAPPDWAIALSEKVETGFRGVRADIHLLDNSVGAVKERIIVLETWKKETEERTQKHSGGLARASQVDAEHDAAIAEIKQKVDELASRPDSTAVILGAVKDAAKTPTGQKVLGALVTLLLLAMGYATVQLEQAVKRIEAVPTSHEASK